jgi:hypothetical protein
MYCDLQESSCECGSSMHVREGSVLYTIRQSVLPACNALRLPSARHDLLLETIAEVKQQTRQILLH